MLDFNHVLSTPGYDFQQFVSGGTSLTLWQTWRKPRGVNWIYLIGVGGGSSGGTGFAGTTTAGGGQGGGSGAQTTVLIPATFIPDILYIQCGLGGIGPTTASTSGNPGTATYVTIEPDTTITANMTLLFANFQNAGGSAATATVGGTAGVAATIATIANMPLAGRGVYNFFGGQSGTAGGTNTTAGVSLSLPTVGLMVTGGAGAGGSQTSPAFAGGAISGSTGALGQDFFPSSIAGGTGATGATPATPGNPGFISRNYLMNIGGTGGGGASATGAGGISSSGGNGAPGCGGGGSGGTTTQNTTVPRGGNGGPGFVYIISW